jgi:methylated-DNA-[protein]-cysteine S-methyltransferase
MKFPKTSYFFRHIYNLASIQSPLGAMTAYYQDKHIVGLWFDDQKHFPRELLHQEKNAEKKISMELEAWIQSYFNGERDRPQPTLMLLGTDFQNLVWKETHSIPYGETRSYKEIAEAISTSPRAVASALSWNPISILIPCHRVLSSKGELCGYAAGLDRKRALLDFENAGI